MDFVEVGGWSPLGPTIGLVDPPLHVQAHNLYTLAYSIRVNKNRQLKWLLHSTVPSSWKEAPAPSRPALSKPGTR
jgi:hypothetical protein